MTDTEKIKIDILRDALKDAMDTVRALDRKIVFLVSFNAVFLGFVSTLFLKKDVLEKVFFHIEWFYYILGFITFIWVLAFIYTMTAIAPKSNPIDIFTTESDKEFSNDTFFIFTGGVRSSLNLKSLLSNYEKVNSYNKIQKLLYKEIGKLSYIRDSKIKSISISVTLTQGMVFIFTMFILIFVLFFRAGV